MIGSFALVMANVSALCRPFFKRLSSNLGPKLRTLKRKEQTKHPYILKVSYNFIILKSHIRVANADTLNGFNSVVFFLFYKLNKSYRN